MPIAMYDSKTNEITGCKKNTFEYKHELEHKNFNKNHASIIYLGEISQFYTLIFLVLSLFYNPIKWLCLIGIIIMLFCFTFEELYCNYKAMEKSNRKDI